ncbi:MAG: putative toxin-antitoxin system toxin component, PIN family [Candidatus Bathyarchaeota archaeon]|nr:putative toxin-antitoxin system toxin component, PIN family [Candidatus Termiticorpusculum sp.]
MVRVVFDTNVLIRAMLSKGKPYVLFRKAVSKDFVLVISDLILKEFEGVMRRSKFGFTEKELSEITHSLMQTAEQVAVVSKFKIVMRDFKDDMVLETAYDGGADFIVSGDDHLLSLDSFRGISIVSVNQMLTYLEEKCVNKLLILQHFRNIEL